MHKDMSLDLLYPTDVDNLIYLTRTPIFLYFFFSRFFFLYLPQKLLFVSGNGLKHRRPVLLCALNIDVPPAFI